MTRMQGSLSTAFSPFMFHPYVPSLQTISNMLGHHQVRFRVHGSIRYITNPNFHVLYTQSGTLTLRPTDSSKGSSFCFNPSASAVCEYRDLQCSIIFCSMQFRVRPDVLLISLIFRARQDRLASHLPGGKQGSMGSSPLDDHYDELVDGSRLC